MLTGCGLDLDEPITNSFGVRVCWLRWRYLVPGSPPPNVGSLGDYRIKWFSLAAAFDSCGHIHILRCCDLIEGLRFHACGWQALPDCRHMEYYSSHYCVATAQSMMEPIRTHRAKVLFWCTSGALLHLCCGSWQRQRVETGMFLLPGMEAWYLCVECK